MRIAITGGTGFAGRHLARALVAAGHEVVVLARGVDRRDVSIRSGPRITYAAMDLSNTSRMADAFRGCDAVAHCAGINREIGDQTYQQVHVCGTANALDAAREARVRRFLLLSFLRARPECGSAYHESKFEAEQLVRQSGLDFTILKPGMIYGRGDHMLDHISHTIHTLPLFATVGLRERPIRPIAIEDMVEIMIASLVHGRLSRQTVFVLGPETLLLSEAVRRVAAVIGRKVWIVPAPVWSHFALAWICERTMQIPLIAKAQVRMLAEGFIAPAPSADALPPDLTPKLQFTGDQIRRGLPDPGPFTLHDLHCLCHRFVFR